MLNYNIKYKIDGVEKNSNIMFYDLFHQNNQGEIHKDSKCWLCGGDLIGQIGEYEKDSKKYYIYFKCKNCRNGNELFVPKCNVKYSQSQTSNKSKINPPTVTNKSRTNITLTNKNSNIKTNVNQKSNPFSRLINSKSNSKSNTKHKRPKFISYQNKVLFHEPILGDPNSGAIHSSCCSNKCKKCAGRLTGRATKLDEKHVSLFWKCTKCNDTNDLKVHINELD